jgi:peroxin-6
VIVHACDSPNRRLARVAVSEDSSFSPSVFPLYISPRTHEMFRDTLFAAPSLLHNIFSDTTCGTIVLRASPFGNRAPAVPTAKSMTIARVASPLSTHRVYQDQFVQGLRSFYGTGRLVKQGDLVPIAWNVQSQVASHEDESEGMGDLSDTRNPYSGRPNAIVFFVITNIEYDVLTKPDMNPSPDTYIGSTLGELGCWVVPSVTRIVQTGLEHSRVPDMTSYFGFGMCTV